RRGSGRAPDAEGPDRTPRSGADRRSAVRLRRQGAERVRQASRQGRGKRNLPEVQIVADGSRRDRCATGRAQGGADAAGRTPGTQGGQRQAARRAERRQGALMRNPWLARNPWLSLWLSGAN